MTDPIAIELRPSRSLVAILILGHAAAILAAAAGLPGLPAGLITVALVLSLVLQLRAALLRQASSVIALRVAVDGSVQFRERGGDWHLAELDRRAYASPWLIVIRLAPGVGVARRVVFLSDSADPDQLRRLRTWLQWGRDGRSRAVTHSGTV